tara:strand:- start:2078 stop:2437 length:360 start_codon:yes stop_codon:yes gene_type:complete
MDKIRISNIKLFAYHGVEKEEQKLGQNFEIDVELSISKIQVNKSDDLSKTIDYSQVYNIVETIFKKEKFKLIETPAELISEELLKYKCVVSVNLKIRKRNAPINGQFDFVEVEIERDSF